MKKTSTKGMREMNRALKNEVQIEMVRDEAMRLEQQRIQFEQNARMARTNLYGLARNDQRGWVDAKRK